MKIRAFVNGCPKIIMPTQVLFHPDIVSVLCTFLSGHAGYAALPRHTDAGHVCASAVPLLRLRACAGASRRAVDATCGPLLDSSWKALRRLYHTRSMHLANVAGVNCTLVGRLLAVLASTRGERRNRGPLRVPVRLDPGRLAVGNRGNGSDGGNGPFAPTHPVDPTRAYWARIYTTPDTAVQPLGVAVEANWLDIELFDGETGQALSLPPEMHESVTLRAELDRFNCHLKFSIVFEIFGAADGFQQEMVLIPLWVGTEADAEAWCLTQNSPLTAVRAAGRLSRVMGEKMGCPATASSSLNSKVDVFCAISQLMRDSGDGPGEGTLLRSGSP